MDKLLKNKVSTLEVSAEEAGQRLDNFLIKVLKGVPRGHIYRIMRTGEVRVNGGRVKPVYRTQLGDNIRIPPLQRPEREPEQVSNSLRSTLHQAVIYEDNNLIILNKPVGLPVHGGTGVRLGAIEALRGIRLQDKTLELAHRLDRDTSGALLVAKNRQSLLALQTALQHHKVTKIYLALLLGTLKQTSQTISLPLKKQRPQAGKHQVKIDSEGKFALTHVKQLAVFKETCLCKIQIKTGRTHQIRVHTQQIGHPIIGDNKYGDFATNRQFQKAGHKHMFLHAYQLTLPAPFNIQVTAPMPVHFQRYTGLSDLESLNHD